MAGILKKTCKITQSKRINFSEVKGGLHSAVPRFVRLEHVTVFFIFKERVTF
jgi:hypothetical protein